MRSCGALINNTSTIAVTISTWHWARHCGRYLDIPPTAIHDVLLLDPILILISWLEALAAIPHAAHLKSIGTVLHFTVIIVLVLVLLGLQNSLLIAAAVAVAIIIIKGMLLLLILMMTVLFHPIHLLLLLVAIVEIPLRWCR